MGTGLASQETLGRVFGRVWNRTEPFFQSKPAPLAGYPDPLLTLVVSHHLTAGRRMMIACIWEQLRKLRCTKVWIVMLVFNGGGLQARFTLRVNCTVRSCVFLTWAFNIRSLRTSLLMEIGSYNLLSDTSFSGPNIQVSQKRVKSAFKALRT